MVSVSGANQVTGEISVIGGARIGIVNATWPFARLVATAAGLRVTSVFDTYDFRPSDVVSLERYGSIPFFGNGIRIAHSRPDYPAKIVFWCLSNPEELIARIRETGFAPIAPANSRIRSRGLAFRWSAVLLFILFWNGLFFLNNPKPYLPGNKPGILTLAPLAFAFLIGWGTKTSPELQKMVLKDGRSVNEVRSFLSLLQMVSGLLLIVFTILLVAGALSFS
jgi:hypothetical protein